MPSFVGWRYAALVGGLVGAIALTSYPIIIDPMINPEKWSEYKSWEQWSWLLVLMNVSERVQEDTRKHIKQEDVQPGSKLLL